MTRRSATVPTERADRYAKQLASHLGRKHGGDWSPDDRAGWVRFPSGRVELIGTDSALVLRLDASPEAVDELEDVVTRHLRRFAGEPLTVEWSDLGDPAATGEG